MCSLTNETWSEELWIKWVWNKNETVKACETKIYLKMFAPLRRYSAGIIWHFVPQRDLSMDKQIKLVSLWSKPVLSKAKRSDLSE